MKKITLMLAIAMMAIATTASAQFVSGGTRSSMVADTDNYSRLELGYSPVTVLEELDLTGLSLGWTKGISLTQDLPLFLEVGANVMYSFGEKYDIETSLLSLNVPVTVAWKFSPTESISLIPHAGLNLRGHILGTMSYDGEDVDLFDSDEGDGKRFNVGGTVGLAANFNKFMVGLGYTFDFNETWEKTDKLNYLTISIGLKF
ncbi:MAG: outer membrane beta-barrel protein [Alistipes sp.]|nr:outer membrane beta-barrel protein [Alistipes sp.]